jgi:hypothetical protein
VQLYKESFPDNPAFAVAGKKKDNKKKAQEQPKQEAEPK